MSSFVQWLSQGVLPREEVGGKMAALSELVNLGIQVPRGFAISARAFLEFCSYYGLDRWIAAFGGQLRALPKGTSLLHQDSPALAQQARQIRAEFRKRELLPKLASELIEAFHELCTDAHGNAVSVAVRSSAILEDRCERSSAGMYDTFLMINDEQVLCEMVKLCWGSLFSERSISYQRNQWLGSEDGTAWHMAVGVQQMVNARTAGVAMTVSPTTGDPSKICVEATWGLGEALVQGQVVPDSFTLDKVTLEWLTHRVGSKKEQLVCNLDGNTVERQTVAASEQARLCLSEHELIQIGTVAKRIEKHYQHPQDLEWAVSGEGKTSVLHVLQARPQTALPLPKEPPLQARKDLAIDYVMDMFK